MVEGVRVKVPWSGLVATAARGGGGMGGVI